MENHIRTEKFIAVMLFYIEVGSYSVEYINCDYLESGRRFYESLVFQSTVVE